jgi:3-oxoacyl-[acyl-carrier-protein] synthase II
MVNTHRRVVVTGLGVIAPNGNTVPDFWSTVIQGQSAASWVTRFDASQMPCRFACEVKNFDPGRYMDEKKAKRFDRSILYAIGAGKQALDDAGFEPSRINPDRFGIIEGTSVSGLDNTLREHTKFVERGYRSIQPSNLVNAFCGGASSELAIELGLQCQATTITTACSAGNDAIGYGLRAIRDDVADVMLAGATEAPIVDGYYAIFAAAGVMTRQKENPAAAMRPFDRDRDGFVLGEGSAFLVLEELTHALARGARIYCEVSGHGQACDAHSIVALHPDAIGSIRAIERAMFAAGVNPDEVDYVNAHGSATGMNDVLETKALKATLRSRAQRIPISATKPVTGHLAGGAAAIEAVVCALALARGVVPPTANLSTAATGCDLDYVQGAARDYPLKTALSLSAGFGGKHSALLMRKYAG